MGLLDGALDGGEHVDLRGYVERGGRLVEDDERRPRAERHGGHRPLQLAARYLVRVALAEVVGVRQRSEEHTSELQSLMRISYAVFCLKKKNNRQRKL